MTIENPLWGQRRIQAELARLGFKVSARTVAKYMHRGRHGGPSSRWRSFLRQHASTVWACDFFCVQTITFRTHTAAHLVGGGAVSLAPMLSVPIFVLVLGVTRLLAAGLEAIGIPSLNPLMLLQFLLLGAFLSLCIAAGPGLNPDAAIAVIAAMFGVSAMAVQNAIGHISLKRAAATAVMTTNITVLTMDVGNMLLAHDLPREL